MWSVKDIIAHLASFEHILVEVLGLFQGGGSTPLLNRMIEEDDQINDNWVAENKNKTGAEVLSDYGEAQARVMSRVVQIPVETFRQPGIRPGRFYRL